MREKDIQSKEQVNNSEEEFQNYCDFRQVLFFLRKILKKIKLNDATQENNVITYFTQ